MQVFLFYCNSYFCSTSHLCFSFSCLSSPPLFEQFWDFAEEQLCRHSYILNDLFFCWSCWDQIYQEIIERRAKMSYAWNVTDRTDFGQSLTHGQRQENEFCRPALVVILIWLLSTKTTVCLSCCATLAHSPPSCRFLSGKIDDFRA